MSDARKPETSMDVAGLYLEENITDRKMGTLRRMTPITAEGERDTARPVIFVGQCEIMTNMGPMPIQFDIEAPSLSEAVAQFGDMASQAVEKTIQQVQEMRRQQASQLVVPGMGGGMGGMPGGAVPGLPSRSKIQMP